MKRRFTGLTDTGVLRSVNQDDFYIDPQGRFFIVADGMGGHAGGQEASHIATQSIQAYLNDRWDDKIDSEALLEEAIESANQEILDDQEEHPERSDMGTTIVIVLFRRDRAWSAHIGDSRLYRLRGTELEQVTEDQTWVARAMKMGDLTPEEARIHPWRHVLSQCLGRKDIQHIEIQKVEIEKGDRLLLCSDGLTEEVPDPSIQSFLMGSENCEEAAKGLVEQAKENGGSDNITVVIVIEG
ncbi:Stp1/IreP family PP2C-type Ser/Thr phosphatase [Spirulina sp. 06S082]|uniref:Stp1/IreP family PP2C-type Ser/Thr phosphatase n=1 Tax=Spirulina sp. 06S082 TaxID=3110248 RepID=UPI002B213BBE|nr:Stp1/IreP family PP2C-type Ser/Thr phosphatase [Spirulina sp. 06S082]MEA5467501.1 Stp1/IreP family PP2C-type Ser/Thr phosphatase [Spirulina sp. 06S082]